MKRTLLLYMLPFVILCTSVVNKTQAQVIYGTDFWFSFTDNLGVVGVSAGPASNYPMRFVIISVHKVSGTITAPNLLTAGGIPWSTTFTVAANGQTTVVLPYTINGVNAFVDTENAIQGKAFHITTDSSATVYAVNDGTPGGGASVDGEVVLPTTMLDKDYVVNCRSSYWAGNPTDINVIAIQNNTHVTINTLQYAGGVQTDKTYTVTLDKGQTYQTGYYVSTTTGNVTPWNVLTGSEVSADKPIAVISTTKCGGAEDCGACDVMMNEQMPISFWGNKYIIAQPIKRNTTTCGSNGSTSEADYVEVIGKVGQIITFTNWSGTFTKTITAIPGSSYSTYGYIWYDNPYNPSITSSEFNGEANLILSSSQPFGLVQYQKGWQTDNVNNTDPEATVCYPETMWNNNYLAGTAALSGGASTQDIIIVVNNVGAPSPISTMKITNASTGAALVVTTTTCPAGSNGPSPVGDNCWQAINGPAGTNYMFYRAVLPASGVPYAVQNTAGYNFGFYFSTTTAASSYIVQGGGGSKPPIATLLPIYLINFEAKTLVNGVGVSWKVANELPTTQGYVVERSENGSLFEPITGVVIPNGDSYQYIDKDAIAGLYYYRLKSVESNAKYSYSKVVTVLIHPERAFEVLSVVPNPTQGQTLVNYNIGSDQAISWYLTDMLGKTLAHGEHMGNAGGNQLNLDISNFEKGTYFLFMKNGDAAIVPAITKITKG